MKILLYLFRIFVLQMYKIIQVQQYLNTNYFIFMQGNT